MTGKERRDYILTELMESDTPISASNFAKRLQVSRQVIVNDVALLRANNHVIEATNKGYIIRQSAMVERVLKMQHTDADIEKELNTIVDLGGYVKDIFVYHKAYHIVRAPLNIASRLDVKKYLDNLKCGKSISLMTVTSGYHYHTICAEQMRDLMKYKMLYQSLDISQNYRNMNLWNSKGHLH